MQGLRHTSNTAPQPITAAHTQQHAPLGIIGPDVFLCTELAAAAESVDAQRDVQFSVIPVGVRYDPRADRLSTRVLSLVIYCTHGASTLDGSMLFGKARRHMQLSCCGALWQA